MQALMQCAEQLQATGARLGTAIQTARAFTEAASRAPHLEVAAAELAAFRSEIQRLGLLLTVIVGQVEGGPPNALETIRRVFDANEAVLKKHEASYQELARATAQQRGPIGSA